jgi:hypothetical protein
VTKTRTPRTGCTKVVIDEAFMQGARRAGGFETERHANECGPRRLARQKHYRYIQSLRGKLKWEGCPQAMRRDR